MASITSLIGVVCCENCLELYDEVYTFPCTHQFCLKCTNKAKNGAETSCFTCFKICHQDEIKRHPYLQRYYPLKDNSVAYCQICDPDHNAVKAERYCVDCDQHMCDKCSKGHVESNLISKHNIYYMKEEEIVSNRDFCIEHKQRLTKYCKTCSKLICTICCKVEHINHDKSKNLKEVVEQAKLNLDNTIRDIDAKLENQTRSDIIYSLNGQSSKQKFNKVRSEAENYAKKLKDHIDNITKDILYQINTIENDFDASARADLAEANEYIETLKGAKSHVENIVKNGTSVDVFKTSQEFNSIDWITEIPGKVIKNSAVTFKEPSLEKIIATKLLDSFIFDAKEDLQIFTLKNFSSSVLVCNNKLYSVNWKDNLINIDSYDIDTMIHYLFTEHKLNATNIITCARIVNTRNDVYLYYRLESTNQTHILKLKESSNTLVKFTTLECACKISATFEDTLLVRTAGKTLIRLSEDGKETNKIEIPDAAILSSSEKFTFDHQLKNGQYVVTSFNNRSVLISLLNTEGIYIDSFTLESTADISTCTDGERYIFVFEKSIGYITVLSTHLQEVHKFSFPGIEEFCYDKINNKLLLVSDKEIVYFTYYLSRLSN